MGPSVAIDHRLGDLGLQREHPLDSLGRDIVALVVDDQVLLSIGDDDPPLRVEMADIAGPKPTVAKDSLGLVGIAPIAVHHELAPDHDFAILGDSYLGVFHGRPDSLQPNSGARSI